MEKEYVNFLLAIGITVVTEFFVVLFLRSYDAITFSVVMFFGLWILFNQNDIMEKLNAK